MIHHLNEGLTRLLYTRVLTGGDCAIDVGANCGDHTRVMASIVGLHGLVHAIEPNKAHWQRLRAIGENVSVWPYAAGEKISIETLHIPADNGWASLNERKDVTSVQLQSTVQVRLDDIIELQQNPISFIKIDVEGHELHALRGMAAILLKWRPVVVLENCTHEISEFFDEIDYEVLDLLGKAYRSGAEPYVNILARPKEANESLIEKTTIPKNVFQVERDLALKLASDPLVGHVVI
jgi:FkbM family methyltransferase